MHTSGIVWTVLAIGGAVAVAVIVRTKWLQSNTLRKCVVLSLVLHAVVAAACACLGGSSPASWGQSESGPMTMLVVTCDDPAEGRRPADAELPSVAAAVDAADVREAQPEVATVTAATVEAIMPPLDHVPLLEVAGMEQSQEQTEPEASEEIEHKETMVATAAMARGWMLPLFVWK